MFTVREGEVCAPIRATNRAVFAEAEPGQRGVQAGARLRQDGFT